MITMAQKQEVLLRFFREGDSKSKISRDLKVNRRTVRRYIEEYLVAQEKEKLIGNYMDGCLSSYVSQDPKYSRPPGIQRKLTHEVCSQIDSFLEENDRKRREGMRKQIMLKKDIHEALLEQGFSIGYTTVCKYVSRKKHQEREAYIRQDYMPGEACEFDWGEVHLIIRGEKRKLYMATFTGSYSNYRFAMLFERQDTLAFMESHIEFFVFIDGVYQEMVYDNMRVAVRKFIGRSEREPTRALLQLSGFYKFRFRFCNVGKGNEKGHVEKSIEFIRRKAFSRRYDFDSVTDANKHLLGTCRRLNKKEVAGTGKTPEHFFAEEKKVLWKPEDRMACFFIEHFKVDKYSTISYQYNRYSLPDHLVGKSVDVKIFSSKLEFYALNEHVGTHERCYARKQWILDLSHYYQTLLIKPRALHSSVALKQSSELIRELYHSYFVSMPKEFIELLMFCDKHEYSYEHLKGVIDVLRGLCPNDVSIDKIKALLGNTGTLAEQIDENQQTVQYSKQQLQEYTKMTGQN
jgi:transposase